MNTLEQSSLDRNCDQTEQEITKQKISGFEGSNRHLLQEPSLYLSIVIIGVATIVCLNKTPVAAAISFSVLSIIAIIFHILAERRLFRANKEFDVFAAPFEGLFVVTFGSILPGLGLLVYGINSMFTASSVNIAQEVGKLALLVIVPLFNFGVWSTLRRGYMVRPRLAGVMNGFALGLSACWTVIWMKSAFLPHAGASCKLGWMLLLSTSPFLLFAASCLAMDLWHKTETNIKRITTTFSAMGIVLSFLFVFTPLVRGLYVQSQIDAARSSSETKRAEAISTLRSVATEEDLRPWKFPVGGFALGELLIPNRGLMAASDTDRDLFFKLTGNSFFDFDKRKKGMGIESIPQNPVVGGVIQGLALSKSQISGNIDASTFSSSIDWTLTFHNSTTVSQESRCEMSLPKGAVVSRATLWIDGEPKEGAFDSSVKVREAYENVVGQRRDPLLVTMSSPDHILVQSFPVPVAGEQKIRIGFKVPLETNDGKTCSMELPKLLSSNFDQPKRHRLTLFSHDKPINNLAGLTATRKGEGYELSGIVKTFEKQKSVGTVTVQRSTSFTEFATPDWFSKIPRYIVAKLQNVSTPATKRVFVVIDGSALVKQHNPQIKEAIESIPAQFNPTVYIAAESKTNSASDQSPAQNQSAEQLGEAAENPRRQNEIVPLSTKEAIEELNEDLFVGGQDNYPTLREALETAAEQSNSAVLWIHGPQPLALTAGETKALDLVHKVDLADLQVEPGQNIQLLRLQKEDVSNSLNCESIDLENSDPKAKTERSDMKSIVAEVKELASKWAKGTKRLALVKSYSLNRPQTNIVTDKNASAQVTCLWARDEAARLMSISEGHQAKLIGAKYRIVTPLTGAVILQSVEEYRRAGLDPGQYKDVQNPMSASLSGPGLVGAPVDPRYGQSNEVGQLADFGYDTARDIVRLLTAISFVCSLFVAVIFLRGQKKFTNSVVWKAAAMLLVAPLCIHVGGTFFINSFGGLGGGL